MPDEELRTKVIGWMQEAFPILDPTAYGEWNQAKRDRLSKGEITGAFAGPSQSFPIAGPSDVGDAWGLAGHGGSPDAIRRKIISIAKRFGWTGGLPGAAKTWAKEKGISLSEEIIDPEIPDYRLFFDLEMAADPTLGSQWVHYLPAPGTYQHPRYGEIVITPDRAERFVSNFQSQVYQSQLPVDAEHQTKVSGALGWVKNMRLNSDSSVDALVEWTERGLTLLAKKAFKFFSPEWYEKWQDPATEVIHQDVATGGALTTKPFFKGLRPVIASELSNEGGSHDLDLETGHSDDIGDISTEGGKTSMAEGNEDFAEMERQLTEVSTQLTTLTEQVATLTEERDAAQSEAEALRTGQEAQTEALQTATEQIALLETAAQTQRFTELVMGTENAPRWFGDPEKHVEVLTRYAQVFGEDSDEFTEFVEHQNAMAEQLAQSEILTETGSSRPGDADPLSARIAALMKEEGISEAKATVQVLNENPELYAEYSEAHGNSG